MQDVETFKAQLYAAVVQAVRAMGPDIKKMSWFGRNAKGAPSSIEDEITKAA